jgi:hypothetical protein
MDFSTEISQSTHFLIQEIRKMFDAAEARLDWRFARLLQSNHDAVSPLPPLLVVDEPNRVVASPSPLPPVVYESYRDEAMAGADARAHYGGHLPCEGGGLATAWQPARSLACAAGDARLAGAPRRDTRAMATKSVGDLTEAALKGRHITDDILPTTEHVIDTDLIDYTINNNSPTKCSTMVLNRSDDYISCWSTVKGGSIASGYPQDMATPKDKRLQVDMVAYGARKLFHVVAVKGKSIASRDQAVPAQVRFHGAARPAAHHHHHAREPPHPHTWILIDVFHVDMATNIMVQ